MNYGALEANDVNDRGNWTNLDPNGVARPSKNVRNRLQETRDSLFSYSMRANRFLFLVGTVAGLGLSSLPAVEPAPETPKRRVSTKYQDVTVEDPYQWLEEDNNPQVKSWSEAQNQRTRQYLDTFPDRAAIEKQLTEWYAKTSPSYSSVVSRPRIL